MKNNLFRKIAALTLSASMIFALGACGGSTASTSTGGNAAASTAEASGESTAAAPAATKQYVIGIGEAQANDEVTIRRTYLEKYIAPRYNVKFIFSERLADDSLTKEFIENCADSGADAVIDFKTISGQMASLCEEYGMVYATNGNLTNSPELATDDHPLYAGNVASNNAQTGSLFKEWLQSAASEDGSEGFLVATSIASQGNAQHQEITRAILEGLQQKYGLTYDQNIDDLIVCSDTTNVGNDKGILITLYPGSPNKETWLPGISNLLQTGKYGIFLSSGQTYNQSATAVDEVERSFGIDVKVASVGSFGETLTTAFNTKDASGDSSINFATVKSISASTACLFAIVYNTLVNGDASVCRTADGEVMDFSFNFLGVDSAERLAEMDGWDDKETENWIANEEFVNKLLITTNPDATAESIQEVMGSMTFDSIKASIG